MDPTFVTEWGPWAFLAYILIRDILPKLAPDLVSAISKKISTEDRLFMLLENNAKVIVTLNLSFAQLSETLKRIDDRLSAIEEHMDVKSNALTTLQTPTMSVKQQT